MRRQRLLIVILAHGYKDASSLRWQRGLQHSDVPAEAIDLAFADRPGWRRRRVGRRKKTGLL